MRTLIINPPCEKGFERSGRWPSKSTGGGFQEPLFLAYTAAVLKKRGLDVDLVDCRPDYLSINDIKKRLNNVGLIVMQTSTPTINEDIKNAIELKKESNSKIVLVGPHPTVLYKEILKENPEIDFIALREYEYTIKDLAISLEKNQSVKKIKGLAFKEKNKIIAKPRQLIENLDELPFPAREFLPVNKYFEPLFEGKPCLRLISSRGCPYKCAFCLWPQTMYGRVLRTRSPKNVADEIEDIVKNYKIKQYYFDDDTFTIGEERVTKICDEIIKRKISLPFDCLGRVNAVTKKMLEKMKEAGCSMIRYGVESSSQNILNNCNKNITPEQIKKAFELTRKTGIKTHATVMFGLPGETKQTIKETINFVKNLNPDYVQFAIATPYPGTEYYNFVKENRFLKFNKWADFDPVSNSVVEYPNLSKKEIKDSIPKAYKAFYFRLSYIFKKMYNLKSLDEFKKLAKGALRVIK